MDVPAQGESWVGREGEVERGGGVGREREREWMTSSFHCFLVLFRPSRNWVTPMCIGGGRSSSCCLPIQVPISCRNTLTTTPRNNILPAIWVFHSSIKLKYKINHHQGPQNPWHLPHSCFFLLFMGNIQFLRWWSLLILLNSLWKKFNRMHRGKSILIVWNLWIDLYLSKKFSMLLSGSVTEMAVPVHDS